MTAEPTSRRIAVIIPAYRVRASILGVIRSIGGEVWRIYVVDDACPEGSGQRVEENCADPRVRVLYHAKNQGVGGAVVTGYRRALLEGARILVKLDGDGQMDPALIPRFVEPIVRGAADYTKGNRFFRRESLLGMPKARLIGNALLSFLTKLSSGYYKVFDPTNGFTALDADVARALPLEKIDRRYFFESDILFRLYTVGAVVLDVPMDARYGDEVSSLRISRIVWEFAGKHAINTLKRLIYAYLLRDFNAVSVQLLFALPLLFFGACFGAYHWLESARLGVFATSGTVMVAALPTLLGIQLLLAFIGYDAQNAPSTPVAERLRMLGPPAKGTHFLFDPSGHAERIEYPVGWVEKEVGTF
jgi:glycosyltransferase involved in cell wall biosynthesis